MLRKKGLVWDLLLGVFLTSCVSLGYRFPAAFPAFRSFERKFYDWRSTLRQDLSSGREMAIIAIDNNSIEQLGRWPWPRTRIAKLLDKLKEAQAGVIGLDIIYSEPENDRGIKALQTISENYQRLTSSRKIFDQHHLFEALISSEEVRLDADARLASAIEKSGNVVLPLVFTERGYEHSQAAATPPLFSSASVRLAVTPGMNQSLIPKGFDPAYPIAIFAQAALGVGHANLKPDSDGILRRVYPVMRYKNSYIPAYSLALALAFEKLSPSSATFSQGQSVDFAQTHIPLNSKSQMMILFNGPYRTFRYYSFSDVMDGHVDMEAFKNKIVLVGLTATGIATPYATPLAPLIPPVEVLANITSNILENRFISRPPWAPKLEWGLIALVGAFVILALPFLSAFWGFALSFILFVFILGAGSYFFLLGEWVKTSYPAVLLALGYLIGVVRRFFVTEKGKELVEASAIETNKMLGLSFQGQGMLDLAFEKFRLCPLDEAMKEILYNLALDFERKRQFAKAASVLDLIAKKDPKYKDIQSKMTVLKSAASGAVLKSSIGSKKEGTVVIAAGAAKPTLGRYEIQKELGRGAMGIVYLGKDPKINRWVAIKTMSLGEEADPQSVKEIKERFFREAEAAGKLNHPNIIRIFDAGEEDDVAYIAMEFLEGQSLAAYTEKGHLIPLKSAMEYVATVADALAYAHQQGVVHRDIKPANIMILKDGSLRVADFGIARVMTSSKTATGTVMGTPAYMSPEQVAGKKVDGRSDIFSLSVVLFELLTGEKPFKGGDGIGALLFQIANDPHPDPLSIAPSLPPSVSAILNRGLAKNPEARYQSAAELARDIRACYGVLKVQA